MLHSAPAPWTTPQCCWSLGGSGPGPVSPGHRQPLLGACEHLGPPSPAPGTDSPPAQGPAGPPSGLDMALEPLLGLGRVSFPSVTVAHPMCPPSLCDRGPPDGEAVWSCPNVGQAQSTRPLTAPPGLCLQPSGPSPSQHALSPDPAALLCRWRVQLHGRGLLQHPGEERGEPLPRPARCVQAVPPGRPRDPSVGDAFWLSVPCGLRSQPWAGGSFLAWMIAGTRSCNLST